MSSSSRSSSRGRWAIAVTSFAGPLTRVVPPRVRRPPLGLQLPTSGSAQGEAAAEIGWGLKFEGMFDDFLIGLQREFVGAAALFWEVEKCA